MEDAPPQEVPPSPGSSTAEPGRDLSSAIAACFSTETASPPFPDRLVELVAALTNQRNVAIWGKSNDGDEPQIIAQQPQARSGDTEMRIAKDLLADDMIRDQPVIRVVEQYLVASIARPGSTICALLVALPAGAAIVRSIAYERVTLLANLAYAQFRHADLTDQSHMLRLLTGIAGGQRDDTQPLADTLARLMGADYVATGYFAGEAITNFALSGQTGMHKRAQLPAKLRASMREIGQKKIRTQDRYFSAASDRAEGLIMVAERPKRNMGTLQLAGAIFSQAQQTKPPSRWTAARLMRIGAVLLALAGIAMIPIRDGIDIPAIVEADRKRIVTAPLTSIIDEVLVPDQARVFGGETVLVRLDTREIELDIIELTANRANQVLERETARSSRNAALLRNAELEVERLDAQIALLELRRERSVIVAPISGIVVLNDLEQRVGATTRQGEPLLEISDPTQLRLGLTIVERQASRISETDVGVFRPDFDPSLRLAATVVRISPALDNNQDVPALQGTARLEDTDAALRPGLKGVFATSQETRPIWQIVYRNLRDWVLLRLWI